MSLLQCSSADEVQEAHLGHLTASLLHQVHGFDLLAVRATSTHLPLAKEFARAFSVSFQTVDECNAVMQENRNMISRPGGSINMMWRNRKEGERVPLNNEAPEWKMNLNVLDKPDKHQSADKPTPDNSS